MKRLTSIFLVLAMLLTLAPMNIFAAEAENTVFSDMKETDYYAQAATALEQLDILEGYPDGTFGAEKSITRAEMAAVVCRMIDKEADAEKAKGETAFDDVKSDHWASGYINVASEEGIINGDGNGKFRPEDDVKHEEAIKMVVCALGYGDDVEVDAKDWSKGYLEVADKKGISADLKGTKGKASTRGDVAVMSYNGLATDAENAKIPATPVASKKAGEYKGTQKVKLTTATKDADIYYTTDGNTPTAKSTKYTKEISISKTSTLKAIAVKNGVVSKGIMSAEYTIKKVSSGGGGGSSSSSTYTVTFDLNYNDALDTPSAQKIKKGNKVTEPAKPVRDEYNFLGWSTSKDEEVFFDFDSSITKTITLYALWEEKSDAEKYYESTSEIVNVIDVEESNDILTETEANTLMQDSGFTEYPVTYEYDMSGEYSDETTALENSANKHPMYQTYYLSESGEGWVIYIINGEVFANPISFNLESDLGVQLLISTSETITSYDEITNKFYVNIPYESAIIVKTVDSINAETLDSLTIEELCRLSGATVSPTDTEDESVSEDIALLSYDDSVSTLSAINEDGDPVIVVSLGDSYSSGEGIEPFYGQDKPLSEKVNDEDWLAHRSTKSWPSLLEVPGVEGTMANYKTNLNASSTSNYQWYFAASSGAETKHFKNNSQEKKYDRDVEGWFNDDIEGVKYLPPQLNVFDNINGDVDFVTLTIGGNDVGFADIVITCTINCANLHWGSTSKLEDTFTSLWNNFSTTKSNIKQTYNDIVGKAGAQAEIIVAGYPKLLDKEGKGAAINKTEAQMVNKNVSKFNDKIEEIVNECKSAGMNIHFVDVEDEFDGHEAYSSTSWINGVIIGAREQDINDEEIASAYSVHPNASGARAYARCVNAKIEEIVENNKDKKKISGVITIADTDTDMTNNVPLEGAEVVIEISSYMDGFAFSNERGEYTLTNIPHGTFTITVSKEGYIPVTETIVVGQHDTEIIYNITIEAIPEAYEGVGYASGTIYDVRTGTPISGLTLYIREGLGNTTGDTVGTLYMNDSSVYSTTLGLPAGNYTIQVVDERTEISDEERYITSSFNIKILGGMTINNQNGYVSNSIEIEELRIVLTWGATPSDLDSHLVGPTADGGKFHVFYSDKTYGSEANLDVDDTSSYGPETVTIHSFNEGIYTYAIHDYSNKSSSYSTSMANSGAQVKVYRGAELLATYNVPANMDGTLWTVFTYDSKTKQITPINTMSYDSSSGGSLMSLAALEDNSTTNNFDDIISIIEEDIYSNLKE